MRTRVNLAALLAAGLACPAHAETNWAEIGQIFQSNGSVEGGVHRFSFPRADLDVTLDGVAVKPGLALGSWAAFQETRDGAILMGDLVLTEEEVDPVTRRLIEGGLEVTALHSHLIRIEPDVKFLHIGGTGDPLEMARAVRLALEESQTPLAPPPQEEPAPGIPFDTAALDRIIGRPGKADGGIYKYRIPRPQPVTAHGTEVPPTMGTATAINLQPTGDGKAATTGDFVMTASEVNPVIAALTANGLEVMALHNHMLGEEPRLFFLHFWGHDDAETLARGLRAGLDAMTAAGDAEFAETPGRP